MSKEYEGGKTPYKKGPEIIEKLERLYRDPNDIIRRDDEVKAKREHVLNKAGPTGKTIEDILGNDRKELTGDSEKKEQVAERIIQHWAAYASERLGMELKDSYDEDEVTDIMQALGIEGGSYHQLKRELVMNTYSLKPENIQEGGQVDKLLTALAKYQVDEAIEEDRLPDELNANPQAASAFIKWVADYTGNHNLTEEAGVTWQDAFQALRQFRGIKVAEATAKKVPPAYDHRKAA